MTELWRGFANMAATKDREVVIAKGRVSPSVPTAEASIEMIGEWMSGLWDARTAQEVDHVEA